MSLAPEVEDGGRTRQRRRRNWADPPLRSLEPSCERLAVLDVCSLPCWAKSLRALIWHSIRCGTAWRRSAASSLRPMGNSNSAAVARVARARRATCRDAHPPRTPGLPRSSIDFVLRVERIFAISRHLDKGGGRHKRLEASAARNSRLSRGGRLDECYMRLRSDVRLRFAIPVVALMIASGAKPGQTYPDAVAASRDVSQGDCPIVGRLAHGPGCLGAGPRRRHASPSGAVSYSLTNWKRCARSSRSGSPSSGAASPARRSAGAAAPSSANAGDTVCQNRFVEHMP